MSLAQYFIIAFGLLSFKVWQLGITGYWRLPSSFFPTKDIFGEAHHARLERIRRRFLSTWTIPPLGLTVLALVLTAWWRWDTVDTHNLLKPIILVAGGIVTWRAVTMDVELATGTSYPGCRGLMALAWIGVWYHPGFLILLLHTGITWLRSNHHHEHLAVRTMLMFLACLGALPLLSPLGPLLEVTEVADPTPPVLFILLCVCASHYFVPGMKKLSMGPRWYSWMLDNRLHALTISAYLWGWLRFLPEAQVIRVVRRLRPFDRLFQIGTVTVEVGAILILFDQWLSLSG